MKRSDKGKRGSNLKIEKGRKTEKRSDKDS